VADFEIHRFMRLHHHHDDDKEFRAWMPGAYDRDMVPVLLLYITLALPHEGLTAAAYTTAIGEAAAIWLAHGVVVRAASPGLQPVADTIVLRVVVRHRPASAGTRWRGPLAAVRFDGSGTPLAEIALYLPDLIEMIERSNATASDPWPTILRERAIGRAVGRVLAHELGHYLLRSRTHAQSGLMRAVQNTAELVAGDRDLFALSTDDAAQWTALSAGPPPPLDGDCDGAGR
jgi:hypothetical protein